MFDRKIWISEELTEKMISHRLMAELVDLKAISSIALMSECVIQYLDSKNENGVLRIQISFDDMGDMNIQEVDQTGEGLGFAFEELQELEKRLETAIRKKEIFR